MDKVKVDRRLTRTSMVIFRQKTIFTNSTLRLTGNKKRLKMRVIILLIQTVTSMAQSQLENLKLKVASNISSNNLAQLIAVRNNTLKTINTKVDTAPTRSKTINIDNSHKNTRRSS